MDMKAYHDHSVKMEEAGVNTDYIIGWQMGYLNSPEREEQRVTEAYEAGYEDGKAHNFDGYTAWVGK